MNNSELMLAAIGNELEDDATTAAALDAIREESGCTLLAAVLEVARVHKAARDARDVTEATMLLAKDSLVHDQLRRSIFAECLNIRSDAQVNIVTVAGDQWPRADVLESVNGLSELVSATVTVGALWVKREAVSIEIVLARKEAWSRSRRSTGPKHLTGRASK